MLLASFLKRSRKYLVAALILSVLIIGVSAPSAEAAFDLETSSDCGWDPVCGIFVGLQQFVIMIFLWFGKLWAVFLELVVKGTVFLIRYGTEMVDSEAVRSGFRATLGLTNLLFVLTIIIIAFATILRFENYSIKKMLPKLIIAALLVNFSLLIAGLMIDMSNVFTNYFLQGGVEANGIASAFNPQQLLVSPTNKTGKVKLEGYGFGLFLKILLAISIAVFMTMLMTLTMVWVMIMVLVRNVWIIFLLIVMPLIWGFWVLPFFQKHWSKWWENFIKWVTYLPSTTFFLWLAVRVAQNDAFKASFGGPDAQLDFSAVNTSILDKGGEGLFSIIIRMLIVLGLIIGGLRVSKAFAVIGAAAMLTGVGFLTKMGLGIVGKGSTSLFSGAAAFAGASAGGPGGRLATARRWGGKFFGVGATAKTLGRGAASIGAAAAGRLANRTSGGYRESSTVNPDGSINLEPASRTGRFFEGAKDALLGTKGNVYGRTTEWLSKKAAGLGFTNVASFLAKTSASGRSAIEEEKKKLDALSPAARAALYGSKAPKTIAQKIAELLTAEESHELDKLEDALKENGGSLTEYGQHVRTMNPGVAAENIEILKKLVAHNPIHAAELMPGSMTTEKAMKRATTGDIQQWTKGTFEQLEKMGLVTNYHRKAWAAKDSEAHSEVLASTLKKLGDVVAKLDDTKYGALKADFALVAANGRGGDLMDRVGGHLKRLSDDKAFDKSTLSADSIDTLELAQELRRVIPRTKAKSEHSSHDYGGYRPTEGAKKFLSSIAEAAEIK